MLEYVYTTYIYNTVLLLQILFMYNIVVTYKSKHVLSITGIILTVFLGHDEQLQVFECLVAVRSVTREHNVSSLHLGGYLLLTATKSN